VDFKTAPALQPSNPRELFRASVGPGMGDYDVTRDGQRFLITAPVGEESPSSVTVVLHWTADLKK